MEYTRGRVPYRLWVKKVKYRNTFNHISNATRVNKIVKFRYAFIFPNYPIKYIQTQPSWRHGFVFESTCSVGKIQKEDGYKRHKISYNNNVSNSFYYWDIRKYKIPVEKIGKEIRRYVWSFQNPERLQVISFNAPQINEGRSIT